MGMKRTRWCRSLGVLVLVVLSAGAVQAQQPPGQQRGRMKDVLREVSQEIRKSFFDPGMRGLDWDGLTNEARERIDRAHSTSEMITAIFALVEKLKDSHTVFLPPSRPVEALFGLEAQAFGDEVRISKVKEGSRAEKAGLMLGDRIVSINEFTVDRGSIDLAMLYWRALQPVAAMDIELVRGTESPRRIRVMAEIKQKSVITDLTKLENVYTLIREAENEKETFLYNVDGDGIAFLALPSFSVEADFLGRVVGKVKKSRAAVVDLRGNLGGIKDTMVYFTGYFCEKPDTIADVIGRSKTEPMTVKPRSPHFTGPLVVLVDSHSASASEIFARHVQRTGRGVVIGDRTAGRANVAQVFSKSHGVDTVMFYGVEVAVGRIVFPGNEELEGRGVLPNVACVPTSDDQREGRDPCLKLAMDEARKALGLQALQ